MAGKNKKIRPLLWFSTAVFIAVSAAVSYRPAVEIKKIRNIESAIEHFSVGEKIYNPGSWEFKDEINACGYNHVETLSFFYLSESECSIVLQEEPPRSIVSISVSGKRECIRDSYPEKLKIYEICKSKTPLTVSFSKNTVRSSEN